METGTRLRHEGIEHIFASPFIRTVETAYHIAEALDLSVKIEHGAHEWLGADWVPAPGFYVPPDEMCRRFPRVVTRQVKSRIAWLCGRYMVDRCATSRAPSV